MPAYQNLGANSGIVAYEIDEESITVEFAKGACTLYRYTNASAGPHAITQMQSLARAGQGLNSFISRNKPPFEWKK